MSTIGNMLNEAMQYAEQQIVSIIEANYSIEPYKHRKDAIEGISDNLVNAVTVFATKEGSARVIKSLKNFDTVGIFTDVHSKNEIKHIHITRLNTILIKYFSSKNILQIYDEYQYSVNGYLAVLQYIIESTEKFTSVKFRHFLQILVDLFIVEYFLKFTDIELLEPFIHEFMLVNSIAVPATMYMKSDYTSIVPIEYAEDKNIILNGYTPNARSKFHTSANLTCFFNSQFQTRNYNSIIHNNRDMCVIEHTNTSKHTHFIFLYDDLSKNTLNKIPLVFNNPVEYIDFVNTNFGYQLEDSKGYTSACYGVIDYNHMYSTSCIIPVTKKSKPEDIFTNIIENNYTHFNIMLDVNKQSFNILDKAVTIIKNTYPTFPLHKRLFLYNQEDNQNLEIFKDIINKPIT